MTSEIFKSIEWRRRLTVTAPDGVRTDLTGKPVVLQLRRKSGDPPVLELSVGAGITLLDQTQAATKGQATITIDASTTSGLQATSHVLNVLVDGQLVVKPTRVTVRAL